MPVPVHSNSERLAIERRAAQLAAIVECSDDAIISKDLDGIITSWNEGARRLFGYSQEEALGRPIMMLIPEDRRDEEPVILDRIRHGIPTSHFETTRRRKDGTLVDIALTVSPIKDISGTVIGASKIARDITNQKIADIALAKRTQQQSAIYLLTNRLHRAHSLADVYEAALSAIIQGINCQRAAILLNDSSGVMRFVAWRGLSGPYREAVDGHSPWPRSVINPSPLLYGNCRPLIESDPRFEELFNAEGIGALCFVPLLLNGALIGKFAGYYNEPHQFAAGDADLVQTIAHQLSFSIERMRSEEARGRAEEGLKREREVLATIIKRIPVMITLYGPDKSLLQLNPEFERVTRWTAQDAAGGSLMERCYPDEQYRTSVAQFMDGARDGWMDIRMRTREGKDVETAWANIRLSDGRQVGIGIDITERKRAEAQRELLIAELSHRVKNMLAAVISIAQQSFPPAWLNEDAYRNFEARLRGLARTHSRLAAGGWSGVFLGTIVTDELAPYRQDEAKNVRASGPSIRLSPKHAVTIGMAIHELATNAAKYGALSTKSGVVEVDWQNDSRTGELRILWSEQGGPPVEAPRHTGFGRLLLERVLSHDLGGRVELDFTPRGLKCSIALPMQGEMS